MINTGNVLYDGQHMLARNSNDGTMYTTCCTSVGHNKRTYLLADQDRAVILEMHSAWGSMVLRYVSCIRLACSC